MFLVSPITFAGTPAAKLKLGISLVTTEFAPIITLSPIVTPPDIIAPAAIQVPLPI